MIWGRLILRFENKTYSNILESLLERVPQKLSKIEGTLIQNALVPAAYEIEKNYISADVILKETFTDTASREYLVKRAEERAIYPHRATAAIWKGHFVPSDLDVPIGTRFNAGKLNLFITAKRSDGYEFTCESVGSQGNICYGSITPIQYLQGFQSGELTELIIPGNDEEETEAFRERYLTILRKPSTSGNVYDYYNWAMSCKGVGAAKIFPLAYGPGTVKVVVADEDKMAATTTLLKTVKDYIEEMRPIGATVTVASAEELPVNVMGRVKLKDGITLGAAQASFREAFDTFLRENAFDINYVGYARVGNILLETAGVEDYAGLTINGFDHNIELTDEQIAVIGTVTLEVMG